MRIAWTMGLLLLPLVAFAGMAPRVDAVTDNGGGVVIHGEWPDACTPRVVTRGLGPRGMDILLDDGEGTDCVPGAHAFTLSVPMTDHFSPAPSPLQVLPLRIFAARDGAQPLLVGLRLLGGQAVSAPASGFWWPAEGVSGNAVSLDVQGDHLGVALLSHDETGAPEWFFGTARLIGSVAHVDLSRVRGNSPFGRAAVTPLAQPALQADIAFLSSTQAKLWLTRQAVDGQGIEVDESILQRRRFEALPEAQVWMGPWLVAGGDGLPRELEFTASRSQGTTLWLDAAKTGQSLQCRMARAGDDAMAQQCVLNGAAGAPLARFDHVGVSRLDGTDRDGRPVVLLRPRGE